MKKTLFTLVLLLFPLFLGFGQEISPKDIIVLKNGNKFIGEIVLKTDDTVIFQTEDGKRFQFQTNEIARIGQEKIKPAAVESDVQQPKGSGNFGGLIEVNGGVAHSAPASVTAPDFGASVALGSRNAFGSQTFAGIGAGIELILAKEEDKKMAFIPIFIQVQKNLTNKQIKPFVGTKIGYAVSTTKNFKGGTAASLNGGISIPLSRRSAINVGIVGKIQQITGTIIERNERGDFTKHGAAPLVSAGGVVSFQF